MGLPCLIGGLFFAFLGIPTDAATQEELRQQIGARNQEIQRLEEEARQYRNNIAAKEKEAQTLKNQIGVIDLTIKKFAGDIRLTNTRITKTKLEIERLGQEIIVKGEAIERGRASLAGLLAVVSQRDAEGVLTIFVKYRSIGEFFANVYYLAGIGENLQERIKELRALKEELQQAKADTEARHRELAALSAQLSDQKAIQDGQKKERAAILAETQNQERRFQQLLDTTEAQQDAIQKELEALEADLRKLVDPGSLPSKRPGVLLWPAEGIMSQGYGVTAFARRSHFYAFHNGIDIKNLIGTPIVAAEDGEVIATGDTDRYCRRGAYGKYIVVRHGNNLTTMYAHLSLIRVSPGERITRGGLIGYMGSSGLSMGPHVHFTVYDSHTVEIKQSRVCGLMPYGGSVNPLDYL